MSEGADPKGLIRESYRIDGIGDGECRSIFVDWALSLPADIDPHDAVRQQYDLYREKAPDHPMTAVLREGLQNKPRARRRGGGRARRAAAQVVGPKGGSETP